MRALKRIAKWVLGLVAGLLLLVIAALAAVWWKPSLLLNEGSARWALKKFAPETAAHWRRFSLGFEPKGPWARRARLELDELCVKQGRAIEACLPVVRLDLTFSLAGLRPRLLEVAELRLLASRVAIISEPAPEKEPSFPLPDLRVPAFASLFPSAEIPKLGALEVEAKEMSLGTAGSPPLEGSLRLTGEGLALALEANLRQSGKFRARPRLELRAEGPAAEVSGEVRGSVPGLALRLPLRGRWEKELALELEPRWRKGAKNGSAKLSLTAGERAWRLRVGALALPAAIPGRSLCTEECRLEATLHRKLGYPEKAGLRCALSSRATAKGALLPKATATLELDSLLRKKGNTSLFADLTLRAHSAQELFRADLDGSGSLEFSPAWELRGLREPELHLLGELPRFERLRALLAATPWAVPAPALPLEGPVRLEARLEAGATGERLPFRAELTTRLEGAGQRLFTRANATGTLHQPLGPAPSLELSAEALLSDVALEAPPMHLGVPPRTSLDNRFRPSTAAAEPKGKPGLPVRWELRVRNEKPVRVRSNLLPEPVPLELDLRLTSERGPAGHVTILPVPIEVFRKKAQVEKVRLEFHPGSKSAELNGSLVYRNAEALVRILLLGQASEPRVVLTSEPPLSESQIVSLLLFNKSVQELSEEEASSSASMAQAFSDGAFGLFTLFFLSSTPVESVGYDPVTDTYAVRVRLASGTTLSVASDFAGERQYTIRRRLGARWAVSSGLQRDDDKGTTSLLTLLEWFRRF